MPSTMTILDIANRAAVKLGEKQITSLTEDSKFARAMNNIVEPVRDRFLRENDWNSATEWDLPITIPPNSPSRS